MRPISRAFLARQLTAAIKHPACKDLGMWWSEQEAAHAVATTTASAAAAAWPALSLCDECPLVDRMLCAERAELDDYTGLAAGAVYQNGHRHSASTVLRQPTPPHKLGRTG